MVYRMGLSLGTELIGGAPQAEAYLAMWPHDAMPTHMQSSRGSRRCSLPRNRINETRSLTYCAGCGDTRGLLYRDETVSLSAAVCRGTRGRGKLACSQEPRREVEHEGQGRGGLLPPRRNGRGGTSRSWRMVFLSSILGSFGQMAALVLVRVWNVEIWGRRG